MDLKPSTLVFHLKIPEKDKMLHAVESINHKLPHVQLPLHFDVSICSRTTKRFSCSASRRIKVLTIVSNVPEAIYCQFHFIVSPKKIHEKSVKIVLPEAKLGGKKHSKHFVRFQFKIIGTRSKLALNERETTSKIRSRCDAFVEGLLCYFKHDVNIITPH